MLVQVFTMSCCSKENIERNDNTCKSQSAKSDRGMYRICPSKLSKRELEDLYFTLLENNLELKKTINGQDDKIRVLSTKVQRMSNSNDKRMSKEMKECCTTKAFVNEQKDFIAELKETNQRMADRIEQLNMKLSSAKQFSKTSPPQPSNVRTFRPSTSPPKKTPRKSTQTQTSIPLQRRPSQADQPCDENKCRSLMEELKIKIVTLQEELFNVHDEYSTRIGRLETEVSEVRKENVRVCYERTASEHELQNTVKRTCDVLAQYRLTETKCSELATQLAIEKRKVAELETRLKSANLSDKLNKTIEDHLTTVNDDLQCIKCCFKDEHGATESPPFKKDKFIPPRGAPTRWSPSKDMDSTKSSKISKTGDDSGYQDTEEVVLLKQNRELMTRILELQNQVDRMKIRVSDLPEAVPARPSADNTRTTPIKSRSMLRDFAQVPFPTMVSDERVDEPGKILTIEILDNSNEAVQTRNWDDTRAKTVEDADGTIKITEEASDKFSPFELMNEDYRKHYKTDSQKLKIIEKKKPEIPCCSKPESGNVSLKSAPSDVSGPGFNPEKLKYLEAEGIIAKPEFGDDMSKLKEDSSSLNESIPSNPELGFAIPRLASKTSQDKYKAKSDFGQAKKSPAASRPSPHRARDDMEVLHGKLKLPMTEALLANNPTAPKQADETKKKEDCEYCAACSFDKECELIHENATNHRMNKLAAAMQKERAKKHDQHNSLQIPGPIPTSANSKREKNRNVCSHVINPKINGKQTTATPDGRANQPDVPLLDKGQHISTDCFKNDKKIVTHDKKDESIKQNKEDLIVNPKIYEQNTYAQTDGPAGLPDEDSKDDVEKKQSRIVFSMDTDQDPPLLEVKMPTYRPHSERMLPTLSAPTNWCGRATQVERKADVAQRTDQKLAEKSSQAPTNIDPARHQCIVSLYRRRSGSLCYRTVPVGADPPVCRWPGQQDGYCTDKPRRKDKEEVKSPRDQRCCGRAVLTSERGTYTVKSKQTDTSPDNTDLEMSYLSDLPMEKEKKRPVKPRPLSPGEDRTTTFTNTYSYYSPPSHSLLSEGEMPTTTSKPKHTEPDIDRPYLNPALAHKQETPPAQQMEAALNAISEELRRCRTMMHSQRPAEVTRLPAAIL